MAEVIHHINGKAYLYDHHREGDKVVSTYLHPVDVVGSTRPTIYKDRDTQQNTFKEKRNQEEFYKKYGYMLKERNKILSPRSVEAIKETKESKKGKSVYVKFSEKADIKTINRINKTYFLSEKDKERLINENKKEYYPVKKNLDNKGRVLTYTVELPNMELEVNSLKEARTIARKID